MICLDDQIRGCPTNWFLNLGFVETFSIGTRNKSNLQINTTWHFTAFLSSMNQIA
jgi:hypothetical protein